MRLEVRWECMFPDELEAEFPVARLYGLPTTSANGTALRTRSASTPSRLTASPARPPTPTEESSPLRTTGTFTSSAATPGGENALSASLNGRG